MTLVKIGNISDESDEENIISAPIEQTVIKYVLNCEKKHFCHPANAIADDEFNGILIFAYVIVFAFVCFFF